MPPRLTGSVKTGEKIDQNWRLFTFSLKNKETDFYSFDVEFGHQTGYMTIGVVDGKIQQATLDCGFPRPLSSHNDTSLLRVAERIMMEYKS